jgi:hypothetical protein
MRGGLTGTPHPALSPKGRGWGRECEEFRCGFAAGFGGGAAVEGQEVECLDRARGGGGRGSARSAAVEAVHAVEDGGDEGVLGGVEELRDGNAQIACDFLDAEGWIDEAGDQVAGVDVVGERGGVVVHGESFRHGWGWGKGFGVGWAVRVRMGVGDGVEAWRGGVSSRTIVRGRFNPKTIVSTAWL